MNWLNEIKADGYNYIYLKKGARTKLWATKSKRVTDNSMFDEFTAESDYEKAVIKELDKGVLIRLNDKPTKENKK